MIRNVGRRKWVLTFCNFLHMIYVLQISMTMKLNQFRGEGRVRSSQSWEFVVQPKCAFVLLGGDSHRVSMHFNRLFQHITSWGDYGYNSTFQSGYTFSGRTVFAHWISAFRTSCGSRTSTTGVQPKPMQNGSLKKRAVFCFKTADESPWVC